MATPSSSKTEPTDDSFADAANFTAVDIKKALEEEMKKEGMVDAKGGPPGQASNKRMAAKAMEMPPEMKPPTEKFVMSQMKMKEKAIKEFEEVEKKRVFQKINLYCERFPGIGERIPKLRSTCSLAEAEEVLQMARDVLASQNSVKAVKDYFTLGIQVIEAYWGDGSKMAKIHPALGWNLNGMSKLFGDHKFPEFDPLMVEMDIEYPWIGRRSLPIRLVSAVGGMMAKVHMFNTNPLARKMMEMDTQGPKNVEGAETL
jgi:urease gamma subunit